MMRLTQGKQPYILVVIAALALAVLACSGTPASTLNEGKGTRNDPVPARKYTRTTTYDVRAQSAVRPLDTDAPENEALDEEYMKVQFQIKCRRGPDDICDLSEIRTHLKLVSTTGIIYEPVYNVTLAPSDKPLEGQILGGAEQTGWMVYQIPKGMNVMLAMAEYGQDRRAFFALP